MAPTRVLIQDPYPVVLPEILTVAHMSPCATTHQRLAFRRTRALFWEVTAQASSYDNLHSYEPVLQVSPRLINEDVLQALLHLDPTNPKTGLYLNQAVSLNSCSIHGDHEVVMW